MKRSRVDKNVLFNFVFSYIPVILLIFLVQTISSFAVLRRLEENATNVIQNTVARDVSMIEQKLHQAESVASSVAQNISLMPYINAEKEDSFTYVEMKGFANILSSYQTGNPLVKTIALQNDAMDKVVTPFTYYVKRDNFYKSNFFVEDSIGDTLLANSEKATGIDSRGTQKLSDGKNSVIPFFLSLPLNQTRNGSVAVYMDEEILLSSILDLIDKSGGAYRIYSKKGDLIISGGTDFAGNEELISDYSKQWINGENYCVLKESGINKRLSYVVYLPEKYVIGDVLFYRVFLICFNFISLLAGFILCFWKALRKSYSYSQLTDLLGMDSTIGFNIRTDEFKQLYPQISRTQQDNLVLSTKGSQNVLNKLLSGEFETEESIRKELAECKIKLEGSRYAVLLVRYETGLGADCSGEEFRAVLKEEISEISPKTHVYFADRNTTAVLFSEDFEDEDFYEHVAVCISGLEKNVFFKHHIPVVFGVGTIADNIVDVKVSCSHAKETVSYNRLIEGAKIWFYKELPEETDSWYYPIELENALFESVLEENYSAARNVPGTIREENFVKRNLSEEDIHELLAEIKASIKKISYLQSEKIEFEQSGDSVNHFFESAADFLYVLCSNVEQKSQTRGDKICRDIQEFICENYHDVNLTLISLASRYHLNHSYLSTLFKKTVGQGVASYLEMVRVNKAAELLKEGKHSVNAVATMTGFGSMLTFRRAFKKLKGENPSEYIKTKQSNQENLS